MDQEQIVSTGEVESSPVVDLTGLETKITELVDVLQAEQDAQKKEVEKLAKEEEQAKKTEEEQAKIAEEDAKLSAEEEQAKSLEDEEYANTVMTLQETQAQSIDDILLEMQTLNQNAIALTEQAQNQTTIVTEGAFMITLAVVISASMKLLIEQISKW